MRKLFFLCLLCFETASVLAQSGGGNIAIGTTIPDSSAKLEVYSVSQGFLPPRMTFLQRDSIHNPADGLMIFNTSSGCPNYFFNGRWIEWCGTGVMPLATLSGLDCASVDITGGTLLLGEPAAGVMAKIPYTGGNGGLFATQAVASSGVNGLTAHLTADTLNNGSGTIIYSLTGTPDNSGTASFLISLGGQTCSFFVNVGLPAPVIRSSTPFSPSNASTFPNLVLSGPANKTIQVFKNASGIGLPDATVVANTEIGGVYYASVNVSVVSNSSTTFTAKAVDSIGNISALSNTFVYIHDNVPPATPVFTSIVPSSPNNFSVTPSLILTGEVGSTVRVYSGSICAGTPIATGIVSSGGGANVGVIATPNASTTYSAVLVDAAGNVSGCSFPVTYTHDNVAPAAPVIVSSIPASPNNVSVTPTLTLTGEPSATVRIYNNISGTGSPVATTTISGGGTAAVGVTATAFSTTTYTARVTDVAGNVSSVSAPFFYTHTP